MSGIADLYLKREELTRIAQDALNSRYHNCIKGKYTDENIDEFPGCAGCETLKGIGCSDGYDILTWEVISELYMHFKATLDKYEPNGELARDLKKWKGEWHA